MFSPRFLELLHFLCSRFISWFRSFTSILLCRREREREIKVLRSDYGCRISRVSRRNGTARPSRPLHWHFFRSSLFPPHISNENACQNYLEKLFCYEELVNLGVLYDSMNTQNVFWYAYLSRPRRKMEDCHLLPWNMWNPLWTRCISIEIQEYGCTQYSLGYSVESIQINIYGCLCKYMYILRKKEREKNVEGVRWFTLHRFRHWLR